MAQYVGSSGHVGAGGVVGGGGDELGVTCVHKKVVNLYLEPDLEPRPRCCYCSAHEIGLQSRRQRLSCEGELSE